MKRLLRILLNMTALLSLLVCLATVTAPVKPPELGLITFGMSERSVSARASN